MVLKARNLKFAWLLLSFLGLSSCSDDVTSIYSNRAPVRCYFNVVEYTELLTVMGVPGQFASIRGSSIKETITITNNSSSTSYNATALSKTFLYGLGGLIVGTGELTDRNGNFINYCYDLACPICDANNRRLTLTNDGHANCSHCGASFNMKQGGVNVKKPTSQTSGTLRGLYRYYIAFDGQTISVRNHE